MDKSGLFMAHPMLFAGFRSMLEVVYKQLLIELDSSPSLIGLILLIIPLTVFLKHLMMIQLGLYWEKLIKLCTVDGMLSNPKH
jgi:hypothetical protein